MINLLPYDLRKQIKARQHNTILMKSFIVLFIATAILIVTHHQLNELADNQFTKNTTKKQNLTNMEKDISQQSVKLLMLMNIIQLKNQNHQISDYALDITNRLPDNVIVKQLIIQPKDIVNRQIKVTCFSKNPNNFMGLKNTFRDSQLIDNIQISSVSETEEEETPYSIVLTLHLKGEHHED